MVLCNKRKSKQNRHIVQQRIMVTTHTSMLVYVKQAMACTCTDSRFHQLLPGDGLAVCVTQLYHQLFAIWGLVRPQSEVHSESSPVCHEMVL